MDRLTEKNDETYFYPHCFEQCNGAHDTCSECEFDEKVCMRIGKNEDTGLTPEQVMELKERDTAKMCKQSIFDRDGMTCTCGSDLDKDVEFRFCPWCGQRLKKWED